MADDEQQLLVDTDSEQQPLVPKKKSRALVAGAAFGAALLLGAVAARGGAGPRSQALRAAPSTAVATRDVGDVVEPDFVDCAETCIPWLDPGFECSGDGVTIGVEFLTGARGVCFYELPCVFRIVLDLEFDLVLGVCFDVDGEASYARERTIASAYGVNAVMTAGVKAEIFTTQGLRKTHAQAMSVLAGAGKERQREFLAAADKSFAARRGRAVTEPEKPEAYYLFARDLVLAARAKKEASPGTKAAAPDFFWGDDVIGLWDDGGSWFWDDWGSSGGGSDGSGLICKMYPWCDIWFNGIGGSGSGGDACAFEAEVRVPVQVQVDTYYGANAAGVHVGDPWVAWSTGNVQVELEGKVTFEAQDASGTLSAGMEGTINTVCDMCDLSSCTEPGSCTDPYGEMCVFASLQVPFLELPSADICGISVPYASIGEGGLSAEWCPDFSSISG